MVQLNSDTVTTLPQSVATPSYAPGDVTASIVHFGVGAFHRAHEAMYIDRILNTGLREWGICGVGVLPGDAAMRDALARQDQLYTLVTRSPDGSSEARVIGSIVEYLFAPDDPAAVLRKLADPATRIVSLTITEGGYNVDDSSGKFAPSDPATLADLSTGFSAADAAPQSVLGFLAEALRMRKDAGVPAFTVMSCDNIQGNGVIARTALLGFAEQKDKELASWIAENVAFPSSMVDRITPATTDETRASIAAEFEVEDHWPVRSESFEQWVLEDDFSLGRPPLENVGVQLVPDVIPYELMKLRLLNASHQAMSYLGILSGATYVHEVCTDPLFVSFLRGYMEREAIPTLQPVPGISLAAYCDQLISRFGSEAILDTLARQVVDGSDRIAKFLLPVVRDQLAAGGGIEHSALVLAAWSVFLEGVTETGEPTPIVDRREKEIRDAAAAESDAAESSAEESNAAGSFLDYSPVFGDLGQNERLRDAFVRARKRLKSAGARDAMSALAAEG